MEQTAAQVRRAQRQRRAGINAQRAQIGLPPLDRYPHNYVFNAAQALAAHAATLAPGSAQLPLGNLPLLPQPPVGNAQQVAGNAHPQFQVQSATGNAQVALNLHIATTGNLQLAIGNDQQVNGNSQPAAGNGMMTFQGNSCYLQQATAKSFH